MFKHLQMAPSVYQKFHFPVAFTGLPVLPLPSFSAIYTIPSLHLPHHIPTHWAIHFIPTLFPAWMAKTRSLKMPIISKFSRNISKSTFSAKHLFIYRTKFYFFLLWPVYFCCYTHHNLLCMLLSHFFHWSLVSWNRHSCPTSIPN